MSSHHRHLNLDVCYCAVDSELCHKFTQMLVDKKQVITLLLVIVNLLIFVQKVGGR